MEKYPVLSERLFLRSPNINVCFKIRLEGIFTESQFKEAAERISKKHPVLKCTIQIDKDNNAWYIPESGSIEMEFHTIKDGFSWNDWYTKIDSVPFDFSHGPLLRICVIEDGLNTDIIILGHHIIGDGMAYVNLAKDLLVALDGKLDPTPEISFEKKGFKKEISLGRFKNSLVRYLNKKWLVNRHVFSEEEYYTFFKQYRKKLPPGMYLASPGTDTVTGLFRFCKTNGFTVNEVLSSAFTGAILALKEHYPKKEIHLGVAINVRDELRASMSDTLGNFVSGIFVTATYNFKTGFIKNTNRIAGSLRKKLNNYKVRLLAINFLENIQKEFIESIQYAAYGDYVNSVSKWLGERIGESRYNKGLGISNLGKRDFGTYGSFKLIDVCFIPPVFPSKLLTVGIITVNNKLNFCLRYNKSEIDDDTAKNIYKNVIELIQNKNEENSPRVRARLW